MLPSKEDKSLTKHYREEKPHGTKKILKEFYNKEWSLAGVNKIFWKIAENGFIERKISRGQKRTLRTHEHIEKVKKKPYL